LQGTKVNGEKFDIASLKGKVVLVDFWATWCGPCIAEFPNIKKNYDTYNSQGFEVVGISLDQDRTKLETYLEEKQVPWITLHEKGVGGQNPVALQYGIFGIPAMFLVGRDGTVISTHARGPELTALLEKEFSPATDAKKSSE
jgi:thiol-disulfide isomerase/thioredoxin